MLRGFTLVLKLPKMQKGGQSGSFVSMFLFGMSYATASLTCTLGLFITAINTSNLTSGPNGGGGSTFISSTGALFSYGLGMGLLATMITLALALGKGGIVGKFQSILPVINKISAVLLLLVGPFSILYGIWELQILGEWPLGEGVIWGWLNDFMGRVLDIQTDVAVWFSADVEVFGRTTDRTSLLGWPFVAINVIVIIGGFLARRKRATATKIDAGPEMDDALEEVQAAPAPAVASVATDVVDEATEVLEESTT